MASSEEANSTIIYHLTLYVAGDEPNSHIALQNLREICSGKLQNRCQIEVVDVYREFERALKERIVVTPALVVEKLNSTTRTGIFRHFT